MLDGRTSLFPELPAGHARKTQLDRRRPVAFAFCRRLPDGRDHLLNHHSSSSRSASANISVVSPLSRNVNTSLSFVSTQSSRSPVFASRPLAADLTVTASASPAAISAAERASRRKRSALVLMTFFLRFQIQADVLERGREGSILPALNSKKNLAQRPSSETTERIFSSGVLIFMLTKTETRPGASVRFGAENTTPVDWRRHDLQPVLEARILAVWGLHGRRS
jgi:hypothetical protein